MGRLFVGSWGSVKKNCACCHWAIAIQVSLSENLSGFCDSTIVVVEARSRPVATRRSCRGDAAETSHQPRRRKLHYKDAAHPCRAARSKFRRHARRAASEHKTSSADYRHAWTSAASAERVATRTRSRGHGALTENMAPVAQQPSTKRAQRKNSRHCASAVAASLRVGLFEYGRGCPGVPRNALLCAFANASKE
jgi:hypothetical protein